MSLVFYLILITSFFGHTYEFSQLQLLYACPLPHASSGTVYNVFGQRLNDHYASPNSYVSVTCIHGFTVQNGESGSYCTGTGVWSRPLGHCFPDNARRPRTTPRSVQCFAPVISNGYLVDDYSPFPLANLRVECGHQVILRCDPGYEVQGNRESSCLTTGVWSVPIGKCVAKAPSLILPRESDKCDVPNVCNGMVSINGGPMIEGRGFVAQVYSTIYLTCLPGFVPRGATSATCVALGTWSVTLGDCKLSMATTTTPTTTTTTTTTTTSTMRTTPTTTTRPSSPLWCPLPRENNGNFHFSQGQKVFGNSIYFGSSVVLTCNSGYIASDKTQFYCSHGQWIPAMSSCIPAPPPTTPPTLPSRSPLPSPDCRGGLSECCPLPAEVFGAFFTIEGQMLTVQRIARGVAVILRCNPGYVAVGGSRSAQCVNTRLTPHIATCTPIEPNCTLPTDTNRRFYSIDGQQITGTSVDRGMTVLMGCRNQHYYVTGSSRANCGVNGIFVPSFGQCEPVVSEGCPLPNIRDGKFMSQSGDTLSVAVSDGMFVLVMCNIGYRLSPAEHRQAYCSETELIGRLGTCRPMSQLHPSSTTPITPSCGESPKEPSDDLVQASRFGNLETVKGYLENSADPDSQDANGWSALIWAANNNHSNIMEKLLACGADVELKNSAGSTAILFAAKSGNAQGVELLLAAGANPNVFNIFGSTALSFAAQKGQVNVARILLNNGANVDEKDFNGLVPLLWATKFNYLSMVELLLGRGANTNAKDNENITPLMAASKRGYLEVARLLLNNGAKATINAKDNNGNSALSLAEDYGQVEIVDLLIRNGAQRRW